MKIDPATNRIIIDYVELQSRVGELDFDDFIPLWHAADAFMSLALEVGFEPKDVPDLLTRSMSSKDGLKE